MTYRIVLTRRAVKDLEKLGEKEKKRILLKIKELEENPTSKSRKLTDSKIGSYRQKIGDYRAIFDINKKEIIILRIGHRKTIYK